LSEWSCHMLSYIRMFISALYPNYLSWLVGEEWWLSYLLRKYLCIFLYHSFLYYVLNGGKGSLVNDKGMCAKDILSNSQGSPEVNCVCVCVCVCVQRNLFRGIASCNCGGLVNLLPWRMGMLARKLETEWSWSWSAKAICCEVSFVVWRPSTNWMEFTNTAESNLLYS
jgi:hypothetical protein